MGIWKQLRQPSLEGFNRGEWASFVEKAGKPSKVLDFNQESFSELIDDQRGQDSRSNQLHGCEILEEYGGF